ncbi:hypothetical protein ACFQUU_27395 [Herbaspirillum sp. GCM10030257]|uniref:hypothetical protein n=1 Tax=Herbaspirillum sp. GCM10030257 TaxID=3273393 RepID=UPI0036205ABB
MKPLHDAAIERPESAFDVELVILGTLTKAVMTRTIQVLAETKSGTQKICTAYYRRSEMRKATEAAKVGCRHGRLVCRSPLAFLTRDGGMEPRLSI